MNAFADLALENLAYGMQKSRSRGRMPRQLPPAGRRFGSGRLFKMK
ncbi:MAG: hypothetical protein GX054_06075 [Clostridiales bacterium]|nr:hypothetical protein [Clostridiales bacterium]